MMYSALSKKEQYFHKPCLSSDSHKLYQFIFIKFFAGGAGETFFQKKFPPHKISPYRAISGAP